MKWESETRTSYYNYVWVRRDKDGKYIDHEYELIFQPSHYELGDKIIYSKRKSELEVWTLESRGAEASRHFVLRDEKGKQIDAKHELRFKQPNEFHITIELIKNNERI